MKKIIKNLENQLSTLNYENYVKDKQLLSKEEQINKIISSNDFNTCYTILNNSKELSTTNINNSSNLNNNNLGFDMLISKIKNEIQYKENEILFETEKNNNLKKKIHSTKRNELIIESDILKEHIYIINSLFSYSLKIKKENEKKLEDLNELKRKIKCQNKIITLLVDESAKLEEKENFLKNQLILKEKKLKNKMRQEIINTHEINKLFLKNKKLKTDEVIKSKYFITNENSNLISIKSSYLKKISQLKNEISFYRGKKEFSDEMLNKLIEQRNKKMQLNKNYATKIENIIKIRTINRPTSPLSEKRKKVEEEKIINKLKNELKLGKKIEIDMEKKSKIYLNKLKELDSIIVENIQNQGKNQIEFGIDENNPFYSDNKDNIPEKSLKFTSSQFNQFTYIIFKNFEAKHITKDNSKSKIINPFCNIINKYNKIKIKYPSDEFNQMAEELAHIIVDILRTKNETNQKLIKLFINALLYNSLNDISHKLIEYFSLLFNYTKDYNLIEKKFIDKLQTKYKNEIIKLIKCIGSYIKNEQKESDYFTLFKMKDFLEKSEIMIKDKYIEFLFYFMKKFDDPDSKLDDLKFSLLNNIILLDNIISEDKDTKSNERNKEKKQKNINENKLANNKIDDKKKKKGTSGKKIEFFDMMNKINDNLSNSDNNIAKESSKINVETNIKKNKSDVKIEQQNSSNNIRNKSNNENIINPKVSNENKGDKFNEIVENKQNFNKVEDTKNKENSNKSKSKVEKENIKEEKALIGKKEYIEDMNYMKKNDVEDKDFGEDSVTEITNEEYNKQISSSIKLIQNALKQNEILFNDLVEDIVIKRKIDGKKYEYIIIDDLNDKLMELGVNLSDLQISCLCSKYNLLNELRFINKVEFGKNFDEKEIE